MNLCLCALSCTGLLGLAWALKPDLRVMGGRDATPDEYPFAVRIETYLNYIYADKNVTNMIPGCSGAALSATWTLTAKHCLSDLPHYFQNTTNYVMETKQMLRYGDPHKKPSENDKLCAILKTVTLLGASVIRPNEDDIALAHTEPLIVTKYAKVSALDYTALFGQRVTVMGFGHMRVAPTAHDSDFTFRLDKPLQIMDRAMLISCDDKRYKMKLCVVPACGEVQTAYFGDSGGPVLHASGVVGVNSMISHAFFVNDFPSMKRVAKPTVLVITPVSPYLDWINSQITVATPES